MRKDNDNRLSMAINFEISRRYWICVQTSIGLVLFYFSVLRSSLALILSIKLVSAGGCASGYRDVKGKCVKRMNHKTDYQSAKAFCEAEATLTGEDVTMLYWNGTESGHWTGGGGVLSKSDFSGQIYWTGARRIKGRYIWG
eukprot:TCONS_00049000-protein